MKIIKKTLLTAVISVALLSPAMATDKHMSCQNNASIELGKMGKVNEQVLQDHIDIITKKIQKVRHGRGSHGSRTLALKRHLTQMKVGMQQLHDQMVLGGCKDAMHGASIEARMKAVEQNSI